MSLDTEAKENKSNISIVDVLEKDVRIIRAEIILKYILDVFLSRKYSSEYTDLR